VAEQAHQTPESRLYAAGFTRQLEFWRTPDGERVLNLDDAIAGLDSGEIQPGVLEFPALPDQPGLRELTPDAVDAMANRLFRPPPPPPGLARAAGRTGGREAEARHPHRGPGGAEGRSPQADAGADDVIHEPPEGGSATMSTAWDRAANIVVHRQTCAHEAGHAAAAVCLGYEPTSISARMIDVFDPTLEDRPHEAVGHVELPEPDGSSKSLRDYAVIAPAGKLYEGVPGWPPKWPLLVAPLSPDEKQLHALVKMLDLDQRGYHDLLRDAYALVCSRRFDRFAAVVGELLERHHHLDRRMIKAIKAAADDDADRDRDGVISDKEVEKAIEQLRRQQPEEDEVVLESPNGHGPAKSVDEDWGGLVFKSLPGVMTQAEQERELRDLRRRCDKIAREVGWCEHDKRARRRSQRFWRDLSGTVRLGI
jgi:hypothetical protein